MRHEKHNLEGKNYQIVHFDSMFDAIQQVESGYKSGWDNSGNDFGTRDDMKNPECQRNDAWAYGDYENWKNTREMLSKGDVSEKTKQRYRSTKEAVVGMKGVESMFKFAETRKRKRVYREDGAELCIDRVMAGDPMHWSKLTPGRNSNVVTIGIDLAQNSGGTEDDFIRLASLGVVAADLFSVAGYSTEVSLLFCATRQNDGYAQCAQSVKMKEANNKMDVQRLLTMGVLGAFRAIMLAVVCNINDGMVYKGLGESLGVSKEMRSLLDFDVLISSTWETGKEELLLKEAFEQVTGFNIEA
jgi:hypothetical protein